MAEIKIYYDDTRAAAKSLLTVAKTVDSMWGSLKVNTDVALLSWKGESAAAFGAVMDDWLNSQKLCSQRLEALSEYMTAFANAYEEAENKVISQITGSADGSSSR